MNSAFLVDEVFRKICLHLVARSDLLRLAQVCTAFKEVSLDILWASGPLTLEEAFQPLVAWGMIDGLHSYQDDEPSRFFLTKAYFDLYKTYAVRVRNLFYIVEQSIPFTIMESLVNITQEPIFPQLQTLWCRFYSAELRQMETKHTNFLITPRLRTFYMWSSVSDLGPLEQVANVCTSLEKLRISSSDVLVTRSNSERYRGAMSKLLITNPNLEELSISQYEFHDPGFSFDLDPINLPRLKQFKIETLGGISPFLEIGSFLRNSTLPQLKSVCITTSWVLDGNMLLEHLDGLRTCGCTKIEEFELITLGSSYLHHYSPISMTHLRPLATSLVDIVSFSFVGPHHSSLTNEHLLLIASCNTRLKKFRIGYSLDPRRPFVENPTSDLGGIIRFVRVATQLVDLQLSTHLCPVDIEPADNLESTPNLLSWRIDGSIVQDPDKVTSIIQTHLPKLTTLISGCNTASPWNEPLLELLARFLPPRVD